MTEADRLALELANKILARDPQVYDDETVRLARSIKSRIESGEHVA